MTPEEDRDLDAWTEALQGRGRPIEQTDAAQLGAVIRRTRAGRSPAWSEIELAALQRKVIASTARTPHRARWRTLIPLAVAAGIGTLAIGIALRETLFEPADIPSSAIQTFQDVPTSPPIVHATQTLRVRDGRAASNEVMELLRQLGADPSMRRSTENGSVVYLLETRHPPRDEPEVLQALGQLGITTRPGTQLTIRIEEIP